MALKQQFLEFGYAGTDDRLNILISFFDSEELECFEDLIGQHVTHSLSLSVVLRVLSGGPSLARVQGTVQLSADELAFMDKAVLFVCGHSSLLCMLVGAAVKAVKTVAARIQLKSARERVKTTQKRALTEIPEHELPKPFMQQLAKFRKHESDFVTRSGPRKTIDQLHVELASQSARDEWLAGARTDAILGGCAGSIDSVKSGNRCFQAFALKVLGKTTGFLPPSLDELLAYSVTFRCDETFSNYLTHLKIGCMLESKPIEVFKEGALKRAKNAIRKRRGFRKRSKMFIQHDVVRKLMVQCDVDDVNLQWGMLFLITYVFLLRLPSEAGIAVKLVCGACVVCVQGAPHRPSLRWEYKQW